MAKEMVIFTDAEWQELLTDLMEIIRAEALATMKQYVKKAKLVLTGELEQRMYDAMKVDMANVYGEVVVAFGGYGRYKDMKTLDYNRQWNAPGNSGKDYAVGGSGDKNPAIVEAFVAYVKKVGLGNFKYVPGYHTDRTKRMPSTESSIQRIAWAMASNRLRQGKVTRKNVGWYNVAVSAIRKKVRKPIGEKISALLARNTAAVITNNIGV